MSVSAQQWIVVLKSHLSSTAPSLKTCTLGRPSNTPTKLPRVLDRNDSIDSIEHVEMPAMHPCPAICPLQQPIILLQRRIKPYPRSCPGHCLLLPHSVPEIGAARSIMDSICDARNSQTVACGRATFRVLLLDTVTRRHEAPSDDRDMDSPRRHSNGRVRRRSVEPEACQEDAHS